MPLLQFDLQLRPLVGLYARIVRRELGRLRRPEPFGIGAQSSQDKSLIVRSVVVAVGEAYAGGDNVREEFALAVYQRLLAFIRNPGFRFYPRFPEALGHAANLAAAVAHVPILPDIQRVEIADDTAAEAAQRDYRELLRLRSEVRDFSPEGPLGQVWRAEQPLYSWWRSVRPDRWVTSVARLGRPIWASERLAGESVAYLVDFGLDRIESRPDLIDRWTDTAPRLVALASRPDAKIGQLVDCCRVDP